MGGRATENENELAVDTHRASGRVSSSPRQIKFVFFGAGEFNYKILKPIKCERAECYPPREMVQAKYLATEGGGGVCIYIVIITCESCIGRLV